MYLARWRASRKAAFSRPLHLSSTRLVLKQIENELNGRKIKRPIGIEIKKDEYRSHFISEVSERQTPLRNEVGVQLLSRKLHSQIFHNTRFSPPDKSFVRLAREHLEFHGLDPTQSSTLPDTGFTLPPMQGMTIDEHFFRIGSAAAQPWLDLAKRFASAGALPKPFYWHIQSGWTKYYHHADGSSYCEQISAPDEDMLSFDVESMPNYHPYAVMACARSRDHWYSWISPWLLGESEYYRHLIPLGSPDIPRVVVGHNVSYDRARILEEYNVGGTKTRFIDTMSLHVAVKGISSHQRMAWMKYKKSKREAKEQKDEAVEAAIDLLRETQEQNSTETDTSRRAELRRLKEEIEESLPQLLSDENDVSTTSKRWEDITSANSLADVAKLHCNIDITKDTRDDFMTHSREQIVENIQDYLDYCSKDVEVTYAIYAKIFPEFLQACPSPVSFAGAMTMGSSFLTVNEAWEKYIEKAEEIYRELEEGIKMRLCRLAKEAKLLMEGDRWKDDIWLSQLDWTPKVVRKSRGGVDIAINRKSKTATPGTKNSYLSTYPAWLEVLKCQGCFSHQAKSRVIPLILQSSYDGHPLQFSLQEGWTYVNENGQIMRPHDRATRVLSIFGKSIGIRALSNGKLTCKDVNIARAIAEGDESEELKNKIMTYAEEALLLETSMHDNPWMKQLDWRRPKTKSATPDVSPTDSQPVLWPKWYWELAKPKKGLTPGSIDVTIRNRIAPLLLRLRWSGWPLFHSREHGWIFRVAPDAVYETRQKKLNFYDPADAHLQESALKDGYSFYKLPHKDGESANVGSPFGKSFVKYAQDGTLTSPGDEAKNALDMNAQCSYWISSRDRIMNQLVIWQDNQVSLGIHPGPGEDDNKKWGMIIPQVIAMGTVTRRAIEKTWLTASNAKKNRVGSELKAMIQAPDGYAIVGADVDSEELWISSAIGDAQFGLHGATALGWMTLEGTKSAGTDLHSKTASILGISRDQAKIFNYSRIYGAGMKHAVLLLLQSNPNMLPDAAQKQAEKLYASTKGKNTHRADLFDRKFWFGGTESFVFNKLEEIALSDKPQTPALSCGITQALSKEYLPSGFGTDYMTSRINWVVQSSGVDYLHLLIVAMDHLIAKYDIKARYLISVHDELRYLVKEEDKYRAALALQIANLWTRCQFAYRLGMADLPQGVAFFSAVDIDKVLRKEADLPCVTPSQPNPIPPGESLNIVQILERTNGGTLWKDGRPMRPSDGIKCADSLEGYTPPDCMAHRAKSVRFLRAQASAEFGEVKKLAELEAGKSFEGGIGGNGGHKRGRPRKTPFVNRAQATDSDAERYRRVAHA